MLWVSRRGRCFYFWRGCRRTRWWRGWHTGLAGLALFQPFHRRNPERFRAGKRCAVALLAQLYGKRVHHGNLFREHADLDRHLHSVA